MNAPDLAALARSQQRVRNSTNKRRGNAGEQMVAWRLHAAGFLMIEPIHSGFRRVGARWVPCGRVSGDFRAVAPGGRSVLIEAKSRQEVLRYSDLEVHQHQALKTHAEAGGLSILAWSSRSGVALLDWQRIALKPGGSLLWAECDMYAIPSRA